MLPLGMNSIEGEPLALLSVRLVRAEGSWPPPDLLRGIVFGQQGDAAVHLCSAMDMDIIKRALGPLAVLAEEQGGPFKLHSPSFAWAFSPGFQGPAFCHQDAHSCFDNCRGAPGGPDQLIVGRLDQDKHGVQLRRPVCRAWPGREDAGA